MSRAAVGCQQVYIGEIPPEMQVLNWPSMDTGTLAIGNKFSKAARAGLKSTVARNAASLYLIQFANYLLPLIIVPYLVRVLGPTNYGRVAFGRSLIMYFILIVEYGFNLSATRSISVSRHDREKVNQIVFSVWGAKFFLILVSSLILFALTRTVPRIQEEETLLFILFGMVVGNALFPTWLFQGMEKMVSIALINLVFRILIMAGIFLYVRSTDDFLIYGLLLTIQSFGAGAIGFITAVRMFSLKPFVPSFDQIKSALGEGWTLFLSKGFASLFSSGNAFLLGLVTNSTIVGYYSASEQIVKAMVGLRGPIIQAIYPRMAMISQRSKTSALILARKLLYLFLAIGIFLFVTLFLSAPMIVKIYLGHNFGPSKTILRILAALPLVVSISHVFGVQLLIAFGFDRDFTIVVLVAGIFHLAFGILSSILFQGNGMAMAVISTELLVAVLMYIQIIKRKINPIKVS